MALSSNDLDLDLEGRGPEVEAEVVGSAAVGRVPGVRKHHVLLATLPLESGPQFQNISRFILLLLKTNENFTNPVPSQWISI